MAITLTVFTPTYNRAHTIKRVYDSFFRQSEECLSTVEWLIVDDGSTDETGSVVNEWLQGNQIFDIRYIKQSNGGKHTAFNRAVQEARGKYFFTVDSDDWLADHSISAILANIESIDNCNDLAGIIALKSFPNGDLIGNPYPECYPNTSAFDLSHQGHGGERSLVFKTEILKKYPYPVVKGEKFMTECVVYDQIDILYKYFVSNEVLTVCEYQEDGLTSNIFVTMLRNPIGYKAFYSHRINVALTFKERLGYIIHYVAFSLMKSDKRFSYKGKHRIEICLFYPLGMLAYLYYKAKA